VEQFWPRALQSESRGTKLHRFRLNSSPYLCSNHCPGTISDDWRCKTRRCRRRAEWSSLGNYNTDWDWNFETPYTYTYDGRTNDCRWQAIGTRR